MFLLRKSFTYIFILTVIGAACTYAIVAKAYEGMEEGYTVMLSQ